MEPQNIYWIVIDSMRSYKGSGDTRYRINYFDELKKDFFDFKNAYTSAPSTIMSAASMFTGCETIKIARNYSDWNFDLEKIKPFKYYLEKEGYENIPIDNSKRAREMLFDLLGTLENKYFLRNTSHYHNWSNQDVLGIFKNTLKRSSSKKKFVMTWYDCRGDKLINNLIEDHIKIIKDNGNYENSIIIINSDHGYPDPKAIKTSNIIGKGHDLIVTEDNIKVPLLIKIPGIHPKEINTRVSLVDILPTISELLNFSLDNKVDGISLVDLMKNKESLNRFNDRFIRTDTRLLLQDGKITSLINKNYKYVRYHDSKLEELYDIENDKNEVKNIINNNQLKEIKEKFQTKFNLQTETIYKEQKETLVKNINESFKSDNFHKYEKIYFFTNLDPNYIEIIIDFFNKKKKYFEYKIFRTKIFQEIERSKFNLFNISDVNNFKFDKKTLIIVIDEKNYYRILDERFISVTKKLKCDRIFLDFNFEKNNLFFSKWIFPLIKYKKNFYFYKREPILFFDDFIKLFKIMINQYVLKKKVETPRGEDIKKQRDRFMRSASYTLGEEQFIHQFFYNNLLNWGGTQKTIFNLMKNLSKNKLSSQIITRSLSEQLMYDFSLSEFQIQLISGKNKKEFFLTKWIRDFIYFIFRKKNPKNDTKRDNKNLLVSLFHYFFSFIFSVIVKLLSLLVKLLEYVFKDKIVFKCFLTALLIRRQFYICFKQSEYFSSFLTRSNLITLFCYNFNKNKSPKIIINERNDIVKQYIEKNKLLFFVYKTLLNKKKVIFLTNSLNTFKYFNKEKLVCDLQFVYNDLGEIFLNKYDFNKNFKNLKISCIGRFAKQKGQEELIKYISEMKNLEGFSFNFFGRGDLSDKSKKILKNLDNKIGEIKSASISNIYDNTDYAIINSFYEGQSNVMLECFESGKLMIINERLKVELTEIYGDEILDFIYFYSSKSELEKILNINYLNKTYKKNLQNQYNFAKDYKRKFLTISNFYNKLNLN